MHACMYVNRPSLTDLGDAPKVVELVYICDKAYSAAQIVSCERRMLKAVDWSVEAPITLVYLTALLEHDPSDAAPKATERAREVCLLASYLAELALMDYSMLVFWPPTIAAAAVYVARRTKGLAGWTAKLAERAGRSEATILPCGHELHALQRLQGGHSSTNACWRKYSNAKYLRVSLLDAPSLLVAAVEATKEEEEEEAQRAEASGERGSVQAAQAVVPAGRCRANCSQSPSPSS